MWHDIFFARQVYCEADMDKKLRDEWEQLCYEHDNARDTYHRAFSTVNTVFRSVYEKKISKGPSLSDIKKMEAAWDSWQTIQGKMREFCKKYA